MDNESNAIPFGSPPVDFMQTGNKIMENTQPIANSVEPFGDFKPTVQETKSQIFNPFDEQSQMPTFDNSQTNQQQTKYNIIDLFWLINPKFYTKQQLTQNEAHFSILSFNVDFGNLRVAFFNMTNNSIQGNIVYLENLKRTVSGTIYPATAFNAYNSQRLSTTCIEQLFRQIPGAQWQQERPVCKIEKNEEIIRFTIADPKFGTHFYDFISWQREAFLHACKFTFTKGFELSAQQKSK